MITMIIYFIIVLLGAVTLTHLVYRHLGYITLGNFLVIVLTSFMFITAIAFIITWLIDVIIGIDNLDDLFDKRIF